MISIFETLSWLNKFDASHLTASSEPYILQMMKKDASEKEIQLAISSAYLHAKGLVDVFEIAELFLNCSAAEFSMNWLNQASQHIHIAIRLYRKYDDRHRLAVACWMEGIVAKETVEKVSGYANWVEARDIFKKLSDKYRRFYDPVHKHWRSEPVIRSWYLECYQAMMEDILCLPEEIFGWLNEFEPSHLSDVAQGVKKAILEKFEKKQYSSVYLLIQELQNLCKGCYDYLEIPEILVECSLMAYELGNLEEAISLLKQTVSYYNPHTHQAAVARWMLGAVQVQTPPLNSQVATNWEQAITYFSNLAVKASYDGKVDRHRWYQEKVEMMVKVLNKQVAIGFSVL